MRDRLLGLIAGALLALLFGFYGLQIYSFWDDPNHKANYNGSADKPQKIVRQEPADERVADYTEYLAILTGALVLVSAIQIAFLIRSDKTARIAAESAKISADAARTSSQMVIDTERARLLAFVVSYNIAQIENVDAQQANNIVLQYPLTFAVSFRNYGRTPAIIEHTFWSVRVKQRRGNSLLTENRIFEPSADSIIDGGAISNRFELTMIEMVRTEFAREIRDGRCELLFTATVRFKDIFGDIFETAFHYEYVGPRDGQFGQMVMSFFDETKKT